VRRKERNGKCRGEIGVKKSKETANSRDPWCWKKMKGISVKRM
jgi:hypothetical protein